MLVNTITCGCVTLRLGEGGCRRRDEVVEEEEEFGHTRWMVGGDCGCSVGVRRWWLWRCLGYDGQPI